MKRLLAAGFSLMLLSGAALAGGSHEGGHDDEHGAKKEHGHSDGHGHGEGHGHDEAMAIGEPGADANVSKTVHITMLEKDDGSMVFEPASLSFKKGETVKLEFVNKGESDHEFVMDEHKAIMEHKEVMERFPHMEHADPNAVRLEPGQTGTIIWTFNNPGKFDFACLIPGHFEAGMKGKLTVEDKVASN